MLLECDERNEYDLILVDTHPSLNYFQSAMASSHYYLIPLFAEADPSRGLASMVTAVDKIRRFLNPMLMLLGCVITRYDKSNATHVRFEKVIREASKTGKFHILKPLFHQVMRLLRPRRSRSHSIIIKRQLPLPSRIRF